MVVSKGYKDYPREYGKDSVGSKKNTPTMGGALIAMTAFVSIILWNDLSDPRVWIVIASMFVFGGIGYFDDTARTPKMPIWVCLVLES